MRASAALTVVLPTPPFPATMSTRVWRQNPATSMRSRTLVTTLLTLVALAFAAGPAAAAAPRHHVDVIEVNGLIDPVEADFLTRAVHDAQAGGADALVIQLDSGGGVLGSS